MNNIEKTEDELLYLSTEKRSHTSFWGNMMFGRHDVKTMVQGGIKMECPELGVLGSLFSFLCFSVCLFLQKCILQPSLLTNSLSSQDELALHSYGISSPVLCLKGSLTTLSICLFVSLFICLFLGLFCFVYIVL